MERECVSVIVIVRVSVKESVEMRVYGSESKNGRMIVRVLESVCVCEIEFGCEMKDDCVEVRVSIEV